MGVFTFLKLYKWYQIAQRTTNIRVLFRLLFVPQNFFCFHETKILCRNEHVKWTYIHLKKINVVMCKIRSCNKRKKYRKKKLLKAISKYFFWNTFLFLFLLQKKNVLTESDTVFIPEHDTEAIFKVSRTRWNIFKPLFGKT